MSVQVHLFEGPVPDQPAAWQHGGAAGAGAIVWFEGIVRPREDDRPLAALDYEAYEPMASRMIERIGGDLIRQHGLIGMCVEHSIGRVEVGGRSFRLRIASYHRKEGLAAADQFIDRLKQDVPLWKQPVWQQP
jgi:molybdopterin synthase catalytic subunit